MKKAAVVYMVAGISSRFMGKIKQFATVGPDGESLIEYSLNQAIKAGFSKIIFIVGNKTEQPFKEKFGNSYKNILIFYAYQKYDERKRDRPWGTGDALCSAKGLLDCPFVVCNGDDIYGEESFKILFNHFQNQKDEATLGYRLVNAIPETGKIHRGIFQIDKGGYVESIQETFNIEKSNLLASNLKPDDLCSMNIFALHPEVISLLEKNLEIFKKEKENDRKTEFLLPTEISRLIKEGRIRMKIYPTSSSWFGITNPEDEEIVRGMLKA